MYACIEALISKKSQRVWCTAGKRILAPMSHRSYNFDSLGAETSRPAVGRAGNASFLTSISGFIIADEGHMLYEITVEDRRFSDKLLLTSTQAPVWTVRRRFSEFFSFKTALTQAFPHVEALYFPRRKIFSSGTDAHVVQARRIVLEGWLQQLLAECFPLADVEPG